MKRRAAQLFPGSIDGYLSLKDPVEHIVYAAASLWAEQSDGDQTKTTYNAA